MVKSTTDGRSSAAPVRPDDPPGTLRHALGHLLGDHPSGAVWLPAEEDLARDAAAAPAVRDAVAVAHWALRERPVPRGERLPESVVARAAEDLALTRSGVHRAWQDAFELGVLARRRGGVVAGPSFACWPWQPASVPVSRTGSSCPPTARLSSWLALYRKAVTAPHPLLAESVHDLDDLDAPAEPFDRHDRGSCDPEGDPAPHGDHDLPDHHGPRGVTTVGIGAGPAGRRPGGGAPAVGSGLLQAVLHMLYRSADSDSDTPRHVPLVDVLRYLLSPPGRGEERREFRRDSRREERHPGAAGSGPHGGSGTPGYADSALRAQAEVMIPAVTGLHDVGAVTTRTSVRSPTDVALALTPLGRWAVRSTLLSMGIPAPRLGDLADAPAHTLLRQAVHYTEHAAREELGRWLRRRGARRAAEEIIHAMTRLSAREAVERGFAFGLLRDIGAPADPVVRAGLPRTGLLGAYLALWNSCTAPAGGVLTEQQLGLLRLDEFAAVIQIGSEDLLTHAMSGIRQVPAVNELIDDAVRSGHPLAVEVLETVARCHPDPLSARAARKEAYRLRTRGYQQGAQSLG
ncbi:hypothetical protein [Allostreptomyces psammosilenae]|uniref:Uncharacterized protein n=1 Tax=Allostreptomyces psammosilenae TaxID=1892865 RepID=A0A852ZY73_9ACTN|nr:hypothetical protein [Allostreptomyces psammosilenae]NYI07286.1 hypothetical protein [Allostreptomyces psammosilenae]